MLKEDFENRSEMSRFYTLQERPELQESFRRADELKGEIDKYRPLEGDIWETIQEKLRLDWTYNSNAIEGNTLTLGETHFFLKEGLTVKGKPFKDYLDIKNHHETIDFLYEVIKDERPVSEGLIKEINAMLMAGVRYTEAINQFGHRVKKPTTPGQYKKLPNHVLQADKTIYKYVEPLQVQGEMKELCEWLNRNIESNHPVITGAIVHYNMVRIHPFDDGNGRGARILMNLIFIKRGYPPAIIKNEERVMYLKSLALADQGNLEPFTAFMTKSLIETQETIIDDLKKG